MFLLSHWRKKSWENNRFFSFSPPVGIWLADDYEFLVFKEVWDKRYEKTIDKYVLDLSDIYAKSFYDMMTIIHDNLSIFSLRIQDEATDHWNINFGYFNALSWTMQWSLKSVAHYTIKKNQSRGNTDADQKSLFYLNNCKMLQTEKWSFVAKIWLPNDLTLVQPTLFSQEKVTAENVNNTFMSIIDTVNKTFFSGKSPSVEDVAWDQDFKDIVIGESGFSLIKNIRSIYKKSIGKKLDYNLLHSNWLTEKQVTTGTINKSDVSHCESIIKKIENELQTETQEFSGYVYVTKTKNPKEDKNRIKLIDTEFWPNVSVSISLDSDMFAKAHQAQWDHRKIKVRAEIKKVRNNFSTDSSKIEKFEVL